MKILFKIFIIFFLIFANNTNSMENRMILKLKDGDVKIELFSNEAPKHVERIKKLANDGTYDNVVFHRVIEGFMAQTVARANFVPFLVYFCTINQKIYKIMKF